MPRAFDKEMIFRSTDLLPTLLGMAKIKRKFPFLDYNTTTTCHAIMVAMNAGNSGYPPSFIFTVTVGGPGIELRAWY